MAAAGLVLLTGCKDDNESNPTIAQPSQFVLNEPAIKENVDLQKSSVLALTWSQPTPYNNFNAPVVPTYTVQVSPSGNFNQAYNAELDDNTGADYFEMAETYTNGQKAEISTETLNRSLEELMGWEQATVPAKQQIALRVKSAIRDASFKEYNVIYSNVVNITAIPYYIELKPADPEIWWLIGADIADGSWGGDKGKCVIPMQTIEDAEYDKKTGQGEITWTGYLSGNGFKLRGSMDDNWATQWGQGDSFGSYVKNDGGSGNITVPSAGLYTVTLNTAEDKLTIDAYDGNVTVFSGMAISGSFNDWGDTDMTPCSTGWENHDWYISQHLDAGAEIKIKQAGSWDYNRGGSFITYSEGMYVYGVGNGDNLVITESGDYLIIFNDITGYIRFIKQ